MEIRSEPVSAKRNFSSKLWKCFVVMECVYKEELGFSVNECCNWDCFRIGGAVLQHLVKVNGLKTCAFDVVNTLCKGLRVEVA